MERTLDQVAQMLENEGLPTLSRAAGSARLDEALVSIDAPWQESVVRIEELSAPAPFTFTKRTLAEMLDRSHAALAAGTGRRIEQHVISTRLNGYETQRPFGARARRAALTILASSVSPDIAEAIGTIVRRRFRAAHARYAAGPALRYRALTAVFPHERDALIFDVSAPIGVLMLLRNGVLTAIQGFSTGEGSSAAAEHALGVLAASYPLPRTALLIAEAGDAAREVERLQAMLGALWLSDGPTRVIPISRLPAAHVAIAPEAPPDIRLALLARYAALPSD